jgi:hypothetical protein
MRKTLVIALSALVVLLASCMGGIHLRAEHLNDTREITGRVTAIYYGGNSSADLKNVVFLDVEGDEYEFVPRAPGFEYQVERDLSPEEALHRAEYFLRWHPSYGGSRAKKVLAEDGTVIGYELRPLYRPFVYGRADILDILYLLGEDGTVSIFVRLKQDVDRLLRDNGERGFSRGRP